MTAQKRSERAQNVGMSISTLSGDTLTKLGVTDTTQLAKVVPGLTYTYGFEGSPIFSIRGVGFEDTSLGASPTVSIYNDEVPLPFSVTSLGSTLDLQRVEVLKGPQGTLFGENATGGAINYIAGKPTDTFEAGADVSYGRFNTGDVKGFVSGPVSDTLDLRLALQTIQGDGWQTSYTRNATLGDKSLTNARVSLLWKPNDRLRVLATLNGFYDGSESQAPQFYGIIKITPGAPLPAGLQNYPLAPHNDRAADWTPCFEPTPPTPGCSHYAQRNGFGMGSLRIDYNLDDNLTLTSLSAYENYHQYHPFDGDGTAYANYQSISSGSLDTGYEEARLSGNFWNKGTWIVGANFEHDDASQTILQAFPTSTTAFIFGIPVYGTKIVGDGPTDSYAAFGHAEYPITQTLTANAGLRFTQTNKTFDGAEYDNGNGGGALYTLFLQDFLQTGNPLSFTGTKVGRGGAITLGPAPDYSPGVSKQKLDENNVSWRVGLDWKVLSHVLLYANVSQGYKAGSFPVIPATLASQFEPATQESLLAYEAGFKTNITHNLQLDGAGFYYDYTNKQILGDVPDPLFQALPKLINIPKSHVVGFELSAVWRPFDGFTISPSVSYAHSRIDGDFSTFNYLAQSINVTGERFPGSPQLQANLDAEYNWALNENMSAFVGTNVNYQGSFNSTFGDYALFAIRDYALVDLWAGLQRGKWRFQVWGRNVLDQYNVNFEARAVDTLVRYTGLPATYGATLSYRF